PASRVTGFTSMRGRWGRPRSPTPCFGSASHRTRLRHRANLHQLCERQAVCSKQRTGPDATRYRSSSPHQRRIVWPPVPAVAKVGPQHLGAPELGRLLDWKAEFVDGEKILNRVERP